MRSASQVTQSVVIGQKLHTIGEDFPYTETKMDPPPVTQVITAHFFHSVSQLVTCYALAGPCMRNRNGTGIRVLLTSKYAMVVNGIEALLSRAPDLKVVGATLPELTQKFRSFHPEVLVADIVQVEQGLRLLTHCAARFSKVPVVVLSAIDDPGFARTLLNKGLSGYVLKSSTEAELMVAIRYASQGTKFLDPALVDAMVTPPSTNGTKPCNGLSNRESQVLHSIVCGYTNRQIGEHLNLSVKTIETYRARIYTKLELNSRFDLVRYAIDKGLISLHERN